MGFYSSSKYSSISVFLQVFVEIIKFEAHSHGLFNFSKKDSANRHALKTKFIFNSPLLFSKRKYSDKKSKKRRQLYQKETLTQKLLHKYFPEGIEKI